MTTVVAPGGFGKTTLLHQSSEADGSWFGREHSVTCSILSREVESFAPMIARAIGAPAPGPAIGTAPHSETILATLAAWSPQRVCVVLDDVHHLGSSGTGVDLLAHLVRHLPANTHLVLAGRELPPLPLTRLRAAGQLLEFDEVDLLFRPEELAEMAARNGTDSSAFGDLPGWPALIRLALAADADAPLEFLREEVLSSLSVAHRHGVAASLLAGGADDRLLEAVAEGLPARDLAANVPLVDLRNGRAVAHALWSEVADRLVADDDQHRFQSGVVRHLLEDRRLDDAFALAATTARWDLAAEVALESIASGGLTIGAATTTRWLRKIPRTERARPEFVLLRALDTRLGDEPARAGPLAEQARAAFVERGDERAEAIALGELTWARWLVRDIGGILEVFDRAKELSTRFPGQLGILVALIQAAAADLQGDARGALEQLRQIDLAPDDDPALQAIVLNWQASLCVLVGDTGAGLAATEQALEVSRIFGGRPMQVVLSNWFHGDLAGALRGDEVWSFAEDLLAARDRFLSDVYRTVFSASLGRCLPADHGDLLRRGQGHGRDRVFAAVAAAAPLVVTGDEEQARTLLVDVVRSAVDGDLLARNELLRFLPYAAVLVPELAAGLTAGPLGPTHRVNQQLAAMFVDLRAGRPVSWSALPPPGRVLTSFPLPWTLELAAAAHGAGQPQGADLLDMVMNHARNDAGPVIERLRADDRVGPSLKALLDSQPPAPTGHLVIRALGPLEIFLDGQEVDGPDAHRRRVRELLGLLIARGTITRDAATAMLWPELEPARAANNLAQTLRRLRKVLEPDRGRGEQGFFVRQRGDRLELARNDQLTVDLWEAREAMDRARFAEQTGDLDKAASELDAAIAGWRGEPLVDLRLVEGTLAERSAIELALVDASCRAGELRLAQHDTRAARVSVERVLRLHPLSERAHRLAIAIELEDTDHGAARAAFARCTELLAHAGLEVGEETLKIARPVLPG